MFELKIINAMKYFFCVLGVALSYCANASDIKDLTVEECLEFHVIQSEPVGYINDEGETTGLHWEYLDALRKQSGLCINISLFPYARIWKSMENGAHDGGIIFKSERRTNLVKYVGHILTAPTAVFSLNHKKLDTYSDLKNLRIGNIRGAHLSQKFDNDQSLNIIHLTNYEQGTKMIKLGRLDAIAGNLYTISYQLEKYDALNKVNLNNSLKLGIKEAWLQLSAKSNHLDKLPILNKAMNDLKAKGVFRDLLRKYYGPLVVPNKSSLP